MAELPIYPGMRVEVLNQNDELLFVAKICRVPRDDFAELEKTDELLYEQGDDEAREVRLRGFNTKLNRGFWLEGNMLRFGQRSNTYWLLQKLHVVGQDSGRTYSRACYNTAVGTVRRADQPESESSSCKVSNLSYGGAAIKTAAVFGDDASLLLEIKLRKGKEQGPLLCRVRRITERDDGEFEYGCQFITDTQEMDDRVIRTLLEVQMMGMPNQIQLPPPIWPV